jgi:predicted heme/steroid binding protein
MVYPSAGIAVSTGTAWGTSIVDNSTDWNTAYSLRLTSATGPLNITGTTISIAQAGAAANGFLSSTDWNTFNNKQPADHYITDLSGEATATGPGIATVTLSNSAVIGKVLTGINIAGGTVIATDSILEAFGKVQNQINGLIGGSTYKGTWNASTNTPTLTSSVGTQGWYYVVSVAGTTNLNGITDWQLGDWAIFSGSVWQKVDNTDAVVSVNGFTGAVSLVTTDIPEGTNLYYTNTRARQAISLTTTGVSGAATYNDATGVLNIPQYQGGVTSFNTRTGAITLTSLDVTNALTYTPVTNARTLTINGTSYDLSADRTWSIAPMVYPAAGIALSTGTAWGTSITDNSANWNTAYTSRISSLTTTGSSGAATLVSNTLNIPTYTISGLGGVPTTRTITINSTAYDLSANRTWDVGTVTSVAALTLGTTGTDLSSSVATGATTPVITLNVPTASATNRGALSATDWTTFNSKEPAIAAGTTLQYWRGDKTWQTLPIYSLPIASATVLGGIKVGANLSINATTGVLDATYGYTLPVATASVLGGVKIGAGVSVDAAGLISVSTNYQAPLGGTGFVKSTAGTISYDTNTYLTTASAAATYLPLAGGTMTGSITMATSGTSYISMGRFPNSTTNAGEAWLGRASDRSTGTMTVQLGVNNAQYFEIVDYAWTTVTLRAGMNDFSYKGNAILHAGNYNSYSPTLTGTGASGTWGINISGTAAAASSTTFVSSPDGGRNPNTAPLPNTNPRSVSYNFAGIANITGATGNYAGVMTYTPWDGTSASTGDSSYQLAFCNFSGVNASGLPGLALRNGINSAWNATWYQVLHSGNYNSYSPTLTGGGASGTWGINITGSSRSLLFSGDSTKAFLDGLWAGGGSYPGYQFTGGNSRFGFSSTSGVVDVYADGNFYATDSSYLVLHAGNYSSYAVPLSGGTMSGDLTFTNLRSSADSSYGFIGRNVYADTVNGIGSDPLELNYYSGGSVIIGTGSTGSKALYAASLYDSGSRVITSANIGSQSVSTANQATSLQTNYAGGVQTNPQVYFNNSVGVKVAMTGYVSVWSDTLWINGYAGGDVPYMCALHTIRNSQPRMWISAQTQGSTSYGTAYEFVTDWNFNKTNPSVNTIYASGWFRSTGNTGWYNDTYGQGLLQVKANVTYGNIVTYGENYNGWSGYNTQNSTITAFMQNSSGTHGFYQENNAGWTLFWNAGYSCWGLGTDSTDPSYSLHIIKYGGSNTGWIIWSDRRIKENIKTIDNALDKVLSLRGVYYNKIDDPNKERCVGYIAQEVLEVVPELVVYSEELDIYNMNYGPMVSMLTEAVKEHYAKTLAQQAEIDTLKEQVQTLLNYMNNGI